MMRLPVKDSDITPVSSANCVCMLPAERRTLRPKTAMGMMHSGMTTSEISVSFRRFGSTNSQTKVMISVTGSFTMTVVALLMMPINVVVSLMMREINSPVLVA